MCVGPVMPMYLRLILQRTQNTTTYDPHAQPKSMELVPAKHQKTSKIACLASTGVSVEIPVPKRETENPLTPLGGSSRVAMLAWLKVSASEALSALMDLVCQVGRGFLPHLRGVGTALGLAEFPYLCLCVRAFLPVLSPFCTFATNSVAE